MTVAELIEQLNKVDQDLPVIVFDYDGGDHCDRFATGIKIANGNQANFGVYYNKDKWTPCYTPKPTEQFVRIVWNE